MCTRRALLARRFLRVCGPLYSWVVRQRYFCDASFASSALVSMAPGTRVPSAKMIAGVPLMLSFWPSANTLSFGVVQLAGAAGAALLFSIQSSQALARSGAHHTFFDLTAESGDRMLYR